MVKIYLILCQVDSLRYFTNLVDGHYGEMLPGMNFESQDFVTPLKILLKSYELQVFTVRVKLTSWERERERKRSFLNLWLLVSQNNLPTKSDRLIELEKKTLPLAFLSLLQTTLKFYKIYLGNTQTDLWLFFFQI